MKGKKTKMDIVKIIGIAFISVIIIIILKQYKPEFAIYASILAGILILTMSFSKLSSIIELLNSIASKTAINGEFLKILLKITGIALLTEFGISICKDSGETAIASKVDIAGKVTIIAISIPIMSGLLETVTKILP